MKKLLLKIFTKIRRNLLRKDIKKDTVKINQERAKLINEKAMITKSREAWPGGPAIF